MTRSVRRPGSLDNRLRRPIYKIAIAIAAYRNGGRKARCASAEFPAPRIFFPAPAQIIPCWRPVFFRKLQFLQRGASEPRGIFPVSRESGILSRGAGEDRLPTPQAWLAL